MTYWVMEVLYNVMGIDAGEGTVKGIVVIVIALVSAFALSKVLTPALVDKVIAWLDKVGFSALLDRLGTVVSALLTRWCGRKNGQKIEDFLQISIPKITKYLWSKFCLGLDRDDIRKKAVDTVSHEIDHK